ncbi:two-component sensor histidine kinase [Desulfocucumis palustris]|uniref:Two-component sensor histidine kinase n=1 Tax=Desulfocucumis palustris TaxID=1898651 RepID=A0A2L2X8K4_9FIRM|nr:PocR ligand-binding domain-containing protein [Desulfocucumis palustris]GBF32549.1 two-component sensor histidine kinase [Desulfocucumis palustris]
MPGGGICTTGAAANPLLLVDQEKFLKIIEVFTRATDITIDINDARGYPLVEHDFFYGFCRTIRSNPEGLRRCIKSNAEVGFMASATGQASVCKCHAGIMLVAVPILIDGKFCGTITAGQMRLEQPDGKALEQMLRATGDLGFDPRELARSFLDVQVVTPEKCRAAAELISYMVNSIAELIYFHQLRETRTREKLKLMHEEKNRAEMENALRMAELKNLQAQIKPHFLFNTLNTITGLVILGENHKAQNTLYALTGLLRYNFNDRGDLVPLGEELDYVKNYLAIQKMRFGEKIQVEINVQPELLEAPVPCLTLQPLVENACVHGLEFREADGALNISAAKKGTDMEICVMDNGPGFSPAVLDRLNAFLAGTSGKTGPDLSGGGGAGLGLGNVHRRLQLYYNESYGLSVDSKPGCTRVIMSLPVVEMRFSEGVGEL